jgi:hypothetical protein
MKAHALILALALAMPFSIFAQETPRKSSEQGKSQKPLTEDELAEIAGGSGGVQFMLHTVDNPGKADVFRIREHGSSFHIHCVGSASCSSGLPGTSSTHFIENPSHSVVKCNGKGC